LRIRFAVAIVLILSILRAADLPQPAA
jgi:hypothetical protein